MHIDEVEPTTFTFSNLTYDEYFEEFGLFMHEMRDFTTSLIKDEITLEELFYQVKELDRTTFIKIEAMAAELSFRKTEELYIATHIFFSDEISRPLRDSGHSDVASLLNSMFGWKILRLTR